MALDRGKLTNVVQVSAATTVGIITCASNKKVYVKSIIAHAPYTGIASGTAQVYFCPTGVTSSFTNQIFDVDVYAGETVLLEPSYPLVLDATDESIQVGTGSTIINFLITGDKEA